MISERAQQVKYLVEVELVIEAIRAWYRAAGLPAPGLDERYRIFMEDRARLLHWFCNNKDEKKLPTHGSNWDSGQEKVRVLAASFPDGLVVVEARNDDGEPVGRVMPLVQFLDGTFVRVDPGVKP